MQEGVREHGEITELIAAAADSDSGTASELLLEAVYDELRRLAATRVAREPAGQTMQATDLVHEAYLRLVRSRPSWSSKGHFSGAAAEAMRRILVERARREVAHRRGGAQPHDQLPEDLIEIHDNDDDDTDLEALSLALERLEREDATKAALVKLRHFVGLTIPQTADALGISRATAVRYWAYSRARLFQWVSGGG